jgi:hypothetical protein
MIVSDMSFFQTRKEEVAAGLDYKKGEKKGDKAKKAKGSKTEDECSLFD